MRSRDDLLERVSCIIFGALFFWMGVAILIRDMPNELSVHAGLTGWVILTLFGITIFFGFLAGKKGYTTRILNAPSARIIIIVFPAMVITIVLRLFGISGRKYLED